MKYLLFTLSVLIIISCTPNKQEDNIQFVTLKTHKTVILLDLPLDLDTSFTYIKQSDDGCNSIVNRFANKKYKPLKDSGYILSKFPDSTFQVTISYLDSSTANYCNFGAESIETSKKSILESKKALYRNKLKVLEYKIVKTDLKPVGVLTVSSPYKNLTNYSTFVIINASNSYTLIHINHIGTQFNKFKNTSNKIVNNLQIKKLVTQK